MSDTLITIIGVVIAALLSGGTMGAAMIAITKSLVSSLIKQNGELTVAIQKNSDVTIHMTTKIEKYYAVLEERERRKEEQIDRVEAASIEARDSARELSGKLKNRL